MRVENFWRDWAHGFAVAALGGLGGVGLVAHYYVGTAVWPVFLAVGGPALAVLLVGLRTAGDQARVELGRRIRVGLVAGIVGLVAYDAVRWSIVGFFGLRVNPFEALPVFGLLLVGADAVTWVRWVAGLVYHVFNGLGFAVGFVAVRPAGGLLVGVVWALGLELAMLAIYPGWLDIRARTEFTVVSVAGHVAYGLAIGGVPVLLARRGAS